MKTLFKPLLVLAVTAIAFTSCMKDDDTDYDAQQRQEEEALVASLATDKIKIDAYLLANPSEESGIWQEDETKYPLTFIESPKRGIWFEILSEPTEEDDEAYEYELNSQGGIVAPKVKVNYSVSLLNGGEPIQSKTNASIDFATFGQTSPNVFNQIWIWSFIPKTMQYNTNDVEVGGLTARGLKKGSKIRVVTPSAWAFRGQAVEVESKTIPANSPLVYEFEVLSIE